MNATVSFMLNGKPVTVASPSDRKLVWVLRDELGLTGTKVGCEAGLCGACTVLVDFEAVPSCSTTLGEVAGKAVLTIEGLAVDGL
ncbi:MAG: 2Fe-2S iron-sulfur cluster-binding protein, partial [Holophaga sp.]